MTPRPQLTLALLLVAAPALLAGCGSASARPSERTVPTATAAEAQAAVHDLVTATQQLFQRRKWKSIEDMVEEDCTLPNGSKGVDFGYTVNTTDRGPADADIAAVRKLWTG